MIAAANALDAVDAAIKATFPRPGNWRWEALPGSHRVTLGTHSWEAMTFGRWGFDGAEPRFLTKYHDDGSFVLRDGREFLRPIPGREHHDWAKRIEHPVAQTIELGVNLLGPLAAVVRAVVECVEGGVHGAACFVEDCDCVDRALKRALDAFNDAAAAQGFGHQNPPHADGDAAGSSQGREPGDAAPSERVASAPAPSAEPAR